MTDATRRRLLRAIGAAPVALAAARVRAHLSVRADAIRFDVLHGGRMLAFRGRVTGATMAGEMTRPGSASRWTARRLP